MSSNLKSRLQDVLDALRADYPRSAEDVLRQIIDGLPDETSVPQFEYCVFEGPPPAPHESWSAWMDSAPRKGATIRASAHETSGDATDAARYRWLRKRIARTIIARIAGAEPETEWAARPEALDKLIDAGIAEKASVPTTSASTGD